MDNTTHTNKKLKRVGLALTIVSILGIISAVILFSMALLFIVTDTPVSIAADYGLDESINADTTLAILQEKDSEFFLTHKVDMGLNFIAGTLMTTALCIFLIRIGVAWRRDQAFTLPVISSFRWIGIISVIDSLYGLWLNYMTEPSLASALFPLSFMYDSTMNSSSPNGLGGLTTGLLLIAISWVLKHGKNLKEEQDLVV